MGIVVEIGRHEDEGVDKVPQRVLVCICHCDGDLWTCVVCVVLMSGTGTDAVLVNGICCCKCVD